MMTRRYRGLSLLLGYVGPSAGVWIFLHMASYPHIIDDSFRSQRCQFIRDLRRNGFAMAAQGEGASPVSELIRDVYADA
jgi:hypothetical protein